MGGGDAVLMAIATVAPVAFALAAWLFFRKPRPQPNPKSQSKSRRSRKAEPAPKPGQKTRPTLPRLILGNLLVLGFLLSLIFLAGEVWFRTFRDTTDSYSLSRLSKRWFQRHWQRNRAGVRDDIEYTYERTPDKRRITFLGDSFTAGHGVADVADRFANRVRRDHADRWEVHVLAAAGLDTGAELQHLRQFVQSGYRLDTVVLVYCLNDISDILPEWHATMERIFRGADSEPWIVRHSFLVNSLRYRLRGLTDPDVANYYGFIRNAYEGPVWNAQRNRLASLARFCRDNGARFLVVTFPFLHDLGPDYPYREAHQRLDTFWKSIGVPNLDLLPVLDKAGGDLTVSAFDAHPNARAHRIAADAIGPFIEHALEAKP